MSLSIYIQNNGLSYADFGSLIGVTGTAVYRYATGRQIPKPEIMQKIFEITGGKISANDFYDLPTPKKRSRKQ